MNRFLSPKILQLTLFSLARVSRSTIMAASADVVEKRSFSTGSKCFVEQVLTVEQLSPTLFRTDATTHTPYIHNDGDTIGQMLMVASTCQTEGYVINSVHCTVINTALPGEEVVFDVEWLKQGRAFTNQLIIARQNDLVCLKAIVSAHLPERVLLRSNATMPTIKPPEDCTSVHISDILKWSRGLGQAQVAELKNCKFFDMLTMRVDPDYDQVSESNPWVWFKWNDTIGSDINHHICVVAYTLNLLLAANSGVPGVETTYRTVFNMSMWFQDKLSVNKWLLAQLTEQMINSDESLHRLSVWRDDGNLAVTGFIDGLAKHRMVQYRSFPYTQANL